VTRTSYGDTIDSRSLVINGKHDGDTLSDYSTITLAAMLPYFHAPDRTDLRAAVVGLGTGVTAGVLGHAEDVQQVTAVEISSTLVDSIRLFEEANLGLSTNPKVEIVATDGFKYFSRLTRRLDIVVSASSPPWVVGVENLFTPEYYTLVHDALNDDGVFLQWFPLYDMDGILFRTILTNLRSTFPHMRLYRISALEMGILASKSPLQDRAMARRFDEPGIRQTRSRMRFEHPRQLQLISLFETHELDVLLGTGESVTHTLANPGLGYASDLIRFVNPPIDWDDFLDIRLVRLTRTTAPRLAAFSGMLTSHPDGLRCALPTSGPKLFCERFNRLLTAHRELSFSTDQGSVAEQVQAYDLLRQEGVLAPDPAFLVRVVSHLTERFASDPEGTLSILESTLTVFVKDGLVEQAELALSRLRERGLIAPGYHDRMLNQLRIGRESRDGFVNRFLGG
jgi:spermidine synthase